MSALRLRPFHLAAENLTVARGGRSLFTHLSLTLSAGSRLAIVGENGRGKTTLLHTLLGRVIPDAGSITLHGEAGIAEQALEFDAGDTVGTLLERALEPSRRAVEELDAAAAALAEDPARHADRYAAALQTAELLDAWDADRRVDVALEALSACTDRNRLLTELSVGQRYRVRLACLLGAPQELQLLDEPTNHLDTSGLTFLTEKIRAHPGGVALVSHDRQLLADVADHFLDLDPTHDGAPRLYGGGYQGWIEGRRKEWEAWEQEYQRQTAERTRLQDALSAAQNRLSTGWRPDKGTGKHQRQSRAPSVVQQVKRQAQALGEHHITVPKPPMTLQMPTLHSKPTAVYLSVENVSLPPRLSRPVSLQLRGGDKLLVTGPNGTGKSTLLHLMAGTLAPGTGHVRHRQDARISLVGQENPPWDSQRTAREIFEAHTRRLVSTRRIRPQQACSLDGFGLLDEQAQNTAVSALSQGQQRRLELALRLAELPHVLLLDEPSNHLAMQLVDELTEALIRTEAAVVVATHDRAMIRDLSGFRRLRLGDATS
ncbi:ATP-binding cassette domain-containing protein [Nesterenkonia sp.]|uniref:ATP-binding cassette domain-containing protein n=1 Tax=Nesterenkonia sp. TaxID=704201 RepID=UPI0026177C0D|nr:ATP-binding cassette domain-containing protein [Nesterenkonia sp.]